MKRFRSYSFADAELATRSMGHLDKISQAIDWQPIAQVIDQHYRVGKSLVGRPSYPGLVLFKMLLLGLWYDLSDEKLEAAVSDRLSFLRFVGLGLQDSVPDATRLSRFRSALAAAPGGVEAILAAVNQQLAARNVLVTRGILVDATITESARRPPQAGGAGDAEARTVSRPRAHRGRYGYKAHTATDAQGLVLGLVTTPANRHDGPMLPPVLAQIPPEHLPPYATVYADKGYASESNRNRLASKELQDGIMDRAYRNRPLSTAQKQRNKAIMRHRYAIERTFGGMKRWFGRSRHRYLGLAKAHYTHVLMAIGYNLWRLPGLRVS